MKHVYGLGEQFLPQRAGSADGDWVGQVRYPGSFDDGKGNGHPYGNAMVPYAGAFTGNAQFPILYALVTKRLNYAFLFDNVYKQRWDFTQSPGKWKPGATNCAGTSSLAMICRRSGEASWILPDTRSFRQRRCSACGYRNSGIGAGGKSTINSKACAPTIFPSMGSCWISNGMETSFRTRRTAGWGR